MGAWNCGGNFDIYQKISDRKFHFPTLTGRTQQIAKKRNSADNSINEHEITLKSRGAVRDFDILLYNFTLTTR